MKKKEFAKHVSRVRKATRKIQQRVDAIKQRMDRAKQERLVRRMQKAEGAVKTSQKGIRLMGCVDLPTIKEAIVQNNRFKANSDHRIEYLLMQDVELRQLGNVLIIQPKGYCPSDRQVPVSLMPVRLPEPPGSSGYDDARRRH